MLDSVRRIETPEGAALELRPAGPAVRGLAWSIDMLIRSAVYAFMWPVLIELDRFGIGIFFLLLFLLEWFYPVLFEVFNLGATPGKSAMKIRTVHDDGVPVGWSGSMIRNLLRAVDVLPVLYTCGLVSMLVHPDFKRLGDIAAGTLVVYNDDVEKETATPPGTPLPPGAALNREQRHAVLSFAERSPKMSQARAEELADLAAPITGRRGAQGVEALHRIANWLQS